MSQKFNFKSLDSNIPLEFYKFKNNIVIGIDSISLANISSLNSKVVSLSKLLDNNHSFYNRTKEYLDYFAEGEVLYQTRQDLINILNEKNTIQ